MVVQVDAQFGDQSGALPGSHTSPPPGYDGVMQPVKDISGAAIVAYLVVAAVVAVTLASTTLHEAFPERDPANSFMALFWGFFALGGVFFGWRIGAPRRNTLLMVGLFILAAVDSWLFGLRGLLELSLLMVWIPRLLQHHRRRISR